LVCHWFPDLTIEGEVRNGSSNRRSIQTAEYGGRVIATARYSPHAAADGRGAWIVSSLPLRLFNRNQAITAMVLAERIAAGYGDDDPFVIGWREELGL
jgi:hypothetical protein